MNDDTGTEKFTDMAWILWLGIEPIDASEGLAVIALDPRHEQLNHNGTVNAAILFGLAEVAGAGAVVAAMLELAAESYTVVKRSEIDFVGPARGRVVATGLLAEGVFDKAKAALERGEGIEIEAPVEIRDADGTLTTRAMFIVSVRPRRADVTVVDDDVPSTPASLRWIRAQLSSWASPMRMPSGPRT